MVRFSEPTISAFLWYKIHFMVILASHGNSFGPRMRWTFLTVFGWQVLLQAAGAPGVRAQTATSYVPGLDRAYDQVELLAAAGLIATLAAGERPHSRAAFAGWAEEASARARAMGDDALSPRVQEALGDLLRRFAPLAEAGAGRNGTGKGVVALREAQAELWAARSPSRPLGRGAAAGIDGVLNPMLQANQGRRVADFVGQPHGGAHGIASGRDVLRAADAGVGA